MRTLHLLVAMNGLTLALLNNCLQLNLLKILHRRRVLAEKPLSCILHLTLDQCALECLLVKRCRSFNYRKRHGLCELQSVKYNETDIKYWRTSTDSDYVDIDVWPKVAAGPCAFRPCGEDQRCLPTTPFRCINIDCGPAPAYQGMTLVQTTTTLGSGVYYECPEGQYTFHNPDAFEMRCVSHEKMRTCNSDSSWTGHRVYCRFRGK